jgi:amino acid transporter
MTSDRLQAPQLVRALGPVMATALIVGTVIGSGIFKKPQAVAEQVGFFGPAALVWTLGGVLTALGALTLAEVAVLFPRAGGPYVFLREAFGGLAGFLWGWVELWIIRSATLAALATVFAESLAEVLSRLDLGGSLLDDFWARRWLTVGAILALALVNVVGVRWGGWVQVVLALIKVATLVGLMALPWLVGRLAPAEAPVGMESLRPFWPARFTALDWERAVSAVLAVLWAYHGWMSVTPVAEEVRDPSRNIPLALWAGVGIVVVLYLGANLAFALVIPQHDMARLSGTTVAAAFAERLLGPVGGAVASGAVMASVLGALNGNLLAGPRVLYALSADGLAPRRLAAVQPRFRTPAGAILVMAGWASVLVLAAAALARYRVPVLSFGGWKLDVNLPPTKPLFDVITDFAMFGAVVFETLAVATIFAFRRRLPEAPRAYRCPGYPVLPAVYVLAFAVVLVNMFRHQHAEAMIGVAFIAVGALVYGLIRARQRGAKAGWS